MLFTRDPKNIVSGCVLTIGNFDGVHLGHQQIIRRVKEQSNLLGLPSVVIIFEPQPLEYFRVDVAPPRLSSLRDKLELFSQHEIDYVLCLRFDERLAQLDAHDFVQQLLVIQLQAKAIIIGDDFSFGCNRIGGYELLQQYADNFLVEEDAEVRVDGYRVSSTLVRQTLAASDFTLVAKLLGRSYSIAGHVAHGDKRGRELGFPTANIFLRRKVLPFRGVFVAQVWGVKNRPLLGVANLGRRPTINGRRNQLEVHILDFAEDIYGQRIRVEFVRKIRDEIKFASLDALKQQISLDADKAKKNE